MKRTIPPQTEAPSIARFVFGTTAEWIKIQPVIECMQQAGIKTEVLCTHQQDDEIREILSHESFSSLNGMRGRGSLVSILQVPRWFSRSLFELLRTRQVADRTVIWFVHGDTMTAFVATIAAKLRREHLAHIEAGLRSGSIRSPFPEELIRRCIGRLANTHFSPQSNDAQNVPKFPPRRNFEVVVTHGNTVIDALNRDSSGHVDGTDPFVLALLHRAEFLARHELVLETMAVLAAYSHERRVDVRVITDALASERFESLGLLSAFDEWGIAEGSGPARGLTFLRKMPHRDFAKLLRDAHLVVTDSGGVQEETAALGVPCLIFRNRTERNDGLEEGATLLGTDPRNLAIALRGPHKRRPRSDPRQSPSNLIANWMKVQI